MRNWLIEHFNFVPDEDYQERLTFFHKLLNQFCIKVKDQQRQLMNSLFVIYPYKEHGIWKFDDDTRGLTGEPFVGDINKIIDGMLIKEGLSPSEPFMAMFSARPFPGYHMHLIHSEEDMGGNWYTCGPHKGWLCPALFKFFPVAPKNIYVQCTAI